MQNRTLHGSLSLSINLLLKEEVTKELNKDPCCSAKQIHPHMFTDVNTCLREESPPCEHFKVILGARKWFASPRLSFSVAAYCCFLAPQVTCQCLQGGALLSQARSVT
jgi:hypothetical protein